MHPRRKAVYYAIILASILWMTGTITFLFFQDIEVTVQVKRRIEQHLGASKNNFKSSRDKQDDIVSEDGKSEPNENYDKANQDFEPKTFVEKPAADLALENDKGFITANYERYIYRDLKGPGELGQGVTVGADEKEKEKDGYKKHAFNQLVSDKISVHRRLKDYRHGRYVFSAIIV